MNKQIKALFIVVPICFALAGIVVLLSLLYGDFDIDYSYMVVSAVLLAVWAFFIVPAVLFALDWAKSCLDGVDGVRAFGFGSWIGLQLDVIFILLIITSPVTGSMWFVVTVKGAVKNKKTKADINNDEPFKF